jgi:hypothetical protein
MRKQYHGWIVVEEVSEGMKPPVYAEWVDESGERRKEFRGYGESGCASAVEWWDERLKKPIKLEPTIRGCYRVATGTPERELAVLLDRCAQAMNAKEAETKRAICGEWSTTGRKVCEEIAGKDLGPICYYLLGGAWNDVLDWAKERLE